MSVVFWSLLLIFELIQQAALMNFMLYLNILKILKIFMLNISKEKLHISCLLSFWNSTMQTATINKAVINFWSKFHFRILWYSFTWVNRFLLTPSLISPREILPPAPLDTSTTALMRIFSPILNSVMKGWKYRSREHLKVIFCHQKKPKKADIFLKLAWNFFSDICMKCLNPQVSISKMLNEPTVDYHPSPSEFTSRIHPLMFLWTPRLWGFTSHYGRRKVLNSLRLLENFWFSKLNLFIFTYVTKQKFSPGSYHYHSRQEDITHFLQTTFFVFSSSETEKNYRAEKMTKIKIARVLVTSFDKFYRFCSSVP